MGQQICSKNEPLICLETNLRLCLQEPLMDSCKSMRVDLLLRKFSKVDDVLMFVRNVNHAAFTNEQLKELSALAPDEKQVFVFKSL